MRTNSSPRAPGILPLCARCSFNGLKRVRCAVGQIGAQCAHAGDPLGTSEGHGALRRCNPQVQGRRSRRDESVTTPAKASAEKSLGEAAGGPLEGLEAKLHCSRGLP
jgi:hypothetical protein